MLTIKNQAGSDLVRERENSARPLLAFGGLILLLVLLVGCAPSGPRALLAGKRLLDEGQYPEAIQTLKTATLLLGGTNALAWNYLGLAYQHLGANAEAEWAYQRALALNRDFIEVRYNLGCLWLGQNKLEAAKGEFTAYTLRRRDAVEGFLKLGATQLRARELSAAERSFNEALSLNPQNPVALNWLGLTRLQRGKPAEAAQYFESALKQQPLYRPALLNLAIVSHHYLDDRQLALERYREYLALKPPADHADAVAATVRQLEQELGPVPRASATNAVVQSSPTANALKPSAAPPPKPPTTNAARVASAPKSEPVAHPTKSAGANAPKVESQRTNSSVPPPKLPPGHYAYLSPPQPLPGNRADAEISFARGLQAQQAHRLPEALQAYQLAARQDPSLFEAHYNLGLVATETGNLSLALKSYENALAIQSTSLEPRSKLDARYNFALALEQANYVVDAVNELEKVVAASPNETRAHLALGILYAQQLHQPAKARQHYLKVLEVEPRHPQATVIRYWLAQN